MGMPRLRWQPCSMRTGTQVARMIGHLLLTSLHSASGAGGNDGEGVSPPRAVEKPGAYLHGGRGRPGNGLYITGAEQAKSIFDV